MRGLSLAAVAVMATLAVAPGTTRGAPTVSVKARTAIEIDPIRRDLDGIVVRGRVVDKLSRAPIGWVDVRVHLDQLTRNAVTDADGHFEARFQVSGGRHDLAVEFAGDLSHDPSRYEIANFDVTKNPLDLDVTLSRSVASYGVDPITIKLDATSDFGGVALPIAVYLGPESDDPADLPRLQTVTTDSSGSATIELAADRIGDPGRHRLVARFPGDDAYDAAEGQASYAVKSDTTITFAVASTDIAYEDSLSGAGVVTDAVGNPIAGGAVSLRVGEKHLVDTATDDQGGYSFRVAASELGPDKHTVQAVFEPSAEWHRGSRSEPATITVARPEPVPVSYTVAAFAAAALLVLAFVAMRTRPWEAWLARWRSKRADEDGEADPDDDTDAEVHTGLSLARPSLVSTLRRTKDHGFSGVVRHAVNHRAVGGARLTLSFGDDRVETCDADGAGRFNFDTLSMGTWKVEVAGFGFVTERFDVSVPHRGELRGARVDLLPVRERIFALYGRAARPLLPDPGLWGIWTPRQIFDHVRDSRPPASALSSLTDFVEEAYFSQRTPDESVIDEARGRIARAQTEISSQPEA